MWQTCCFMATKSRMCLLTGFPVSRLRGNNLDSQHVANLLLYGHKEPHVFAYRLPRVEAPGKQFGFAACGKLVALWPQRAACVCLQASPCRGSGETIWIRSMWQTCCFMATKSRMCLLTGFP